MGSPYIDGGRRIAQLLGLAPSAPPPGRIPAMLAARRRIIDQPMVPTPPPTQNGPVVVGMRSDGLIPRHDRLAAILDDDELEPALYDDILMRAEAIARPVEEGRWAGGFVPSGGDDYLGVATYPTENAWWREYNPRGTRRHEIMHGYNEAARKGYEGMPFWPRMVAKTPEAISYPLDELLARHAGGESFMDVPWDRYAHGYTKMGKPGAARVAQGLHAAQKAGQFASDYAPYMAGAAVGTGLTAYALTKEEEEDRQALLAYLRSVKPE